MTVSPSDFEKGLMKDSIQLLDVRTAAEFETGHIKNAMLADWNDKKQFYYRVGYVDKNRPVYIYCLAGGRSAAAADWMRANGFQQVIELKGGINAWKQHNKPLEGRSAEKQMTIEAYNKAVSNGKTVLVDIGAAWCPPCIKMQPVLDGMIKDSTLHFTFLKIDAGVHTDLLKALKVEPLPVFIIYKNGKEVWRKEGMATRSEFIEHL